MATEYISREAAIETVLEKPDMTPDEKAGIVARLNALHPADVRPVVRAFWVGKHDGVGICSNCNRLDHIDPLATHCRYCGADLRKVVEIDQVKEDEQ